MRLAVQDPVACFRRILNTLTVRTNTLRSVWVASFGVSSLDCLDASPRFLQRAVLSLLHNSVSTFSMLRHDGEHLSKIMQCTHASVHERF